jgi:endonuclease/exonuclease/phosphatase family metal-dependent hydrolase
MAIRLWLALLLVATTTTCAHFQQRESLTPLRVLTYNIRSGNGDLRRTAETIRRLAPDIAGLQEVDVNWAERSRFEDQAKSLGEMLEMQVRFAPIYALRGADSTQPARQFGVALLSKFPIVGWKNDTMTRLSTQVANAVAAPAPGLLEAAIEVGGEPVRVFNTHLDYRADPRVRAKQVEEMLAYIGDATQPTLVLGDLNAGPETLELQPLLRRLRDTWQSTNEAGFTYPADQPVKRIDYVLASEHFRVRSASVPVTQASDHRPVLIDLLLYLSRRASAAR